MSYQPDIHAFFPHTRRGHGTTHPRERVNKAGVTVRHACICVNPACSLHRRQENGKAVKGESHVDPKANAEEWRAERGYHKDTPLENCR